MREIHEIVLGSEVAELLHAFREESDSVVLLGRSFGGAVVVTGAAPEPSSETTWERLRALRHGPVGRLAEAPSAEGLLPGDVLVTAPAGSAPQDWSATCLVWRGAERGTRLEAVELSLDEETTTSIGDENPREGSP